MNDILKWVRQNPKRNRKRLCKRFENDDEFAYKFAKQYFEYQDFLKHFITESAWAYEWAREFGDRQIMVHKITKEKHAYLWGCEFGSSSKMADVIENPDFAYYWTKDVGTYTSEMKKIVESCGNATWIQHWNDLDHDHYIAA